jgi:cyclopropane fatty-acyl-phospholipid synthase-like methyltransferase
MTETQKSAQYSGELFDAWDTYRKVVQGDYMSHRALSEAVERVLSNRFPDRRFSILDLGCGDASVIAPILQRFSPVSYNGVDLSEKALSIAASALAAIGCAVQLAHVDMLFALEADRSFDVIYSSFVLHHLTTNKKAEFFRRASQRLTPNGVILLVDVAREESETLQVYHENYCRWVRATWGGLSPDEREAVCEHLSKNDFPETISVLEAQARLAGLTPVVGGAKHGWHHLECFARS